MPSGSRVVGLCLVALGLLVGAGSACAQITPSDLLGTWGTTDSTGRFFALPEDEVWEEDSVWVTTLYEEVAFSDTLVTWTTISRSTGFLSAWREEIGYRIEDGHLMLADSLGSDIAVVGDSLTLATEIPGEEPYVSVFRRSTSTAAQDLVGTWIGDIVDERTGVVSGFGLGFLPDGRMDESLGEDMSHYLVAGPYLLLYTELTPEDAAEGEIQHYEVMRMEITDDELQLHPPDEPPLHLYRLD